MPRILLVDDDPDILTFAGQVLAQGGHVVTTADGAMSALDQLEKREFDAVITDANMPLYSGYDLVKTLRSDARYKNLPIAMLTGRRGREDIERAIQAGVDDYIVKPIDPLIFQKKVADLFAKRSAHAQDEDIQFATASRVFKGRLTSEVEIRAVSEHGFVLVCAHRFPPGTLVDIDSPLFAEIGIQPPHLKVLSSQPVAYGEGYESRVTFMGANEAVLQKVRAWVFKNVARNNKRAA